MPSLIRTAALASRSFLTLRPINKPSSRYVSLQIMRLAGCSLILFQLYQLKLKQRNLKVVLSIGGGLNSQAGHFGFVGTASKRAAFVNSAITLIESYGLDGV